MKTKLQRSERQQLILAGVLRDLRRICPATVNNRNVNSSGAYEGTPKARRRQRERQLQRARAAREGLAVVNLWRWLGRSPSGSDRVLVHRDLLRLEAMGLLTRQAGRSGRRTTHVKLTAPGHQLARRLLAEQNALAADDADDDSFAIEDFSMLPLDWPMEAHGDAGEPGGAGEPGESVGTSPPSPDALLAAQSEPSAPSSPPDIPPAVNGPGESDEPSSSPAAPSSADPPPDIPLAEPDTAADVTVGCFPCYGTQFAGGVDA